MPNTPIIYLELQELWNRFTSLKTTLEYTTGSYATLTGVSGTFVSQSQLDPYATLTGVSGTFVTNAAATASLAFLTASNTFTGVNTFNSNVVVSGALNVIGGVTGSISASTLIVNNLTASNLSASAANVDYIDFNTTLYPTPPPPPATLGRIFYNASSGDLSTYLDTNGLYLNNGQQLLQKVHNANISPTLTKGTVVHITGSTNAAVPRVTKADWSNDNGSANTLGIIMSDIAFGGEGYVLTQGVINYNTSDWGNGDIIYLSGSGGLSNSKPTAPNHTVVVGQVITSKNDGLLYISVQNGNELGELHDVKTNGKTNGDLLIWDSSIPAWKNSSTLGGYTFTGVNTFQNAVTGSSAYFTGNVRINGTASIGLLETVSQSSLAVGDKYIVIMSGGVDHVGLDGAGLLFGSGSTGPTVDENGANAYIKYRNAYDKLEIYPGLRVSGSITASSGVSGSYVGDGSGLANIPISAINGINNYATLTGVSGTFVTNDAATASLAFLTASNVFTTSQIITGSLNVSTSISASQITGSFSGSGALINSITASNIRNFTTDVRNQFTAGSGIYIDYTTGEITASAGASVDLTPYATTSSVSSSFAALTASNIFTNLNTFNNQVNINSILINGSASYATGSYSHAEGRQTITSGSYSHAEGYLTRTTNLANYSHVEGYQTLATAQYSHAEGYKSTASAELSHAEGEGCVTISGAGASHAEGRGTTTNNAYAHSEGLFTYTNGYASHAEGSGTLTSGTASHAEGQWTTASANYSHAEGLWTIAIADNQHVEGKYNQTSSTALMLVGNGTANNARSNILEVYTGSVVVSGGLNITGQTTFGGGVKLPISTKTSNYSLNASSDYVVIFDGANLTGTLPVAVGNTGCVFVVKNLNATSLFITASSGLIDGSTTGITIASQYEKATFVSDNSSWYKI